MNTTSFASRCKRAIKHLATTSAMGRRAFPEASLTAIQHQIGQGEKIHHAEVRLIVEAALDVEAVFRGTTNRQRALELFAQYGIWDTEDNCGVLIYVNLAEHAVEIVADRHVGRRIDKSQWREICNTMTRGFANGEFHQSTLTAIAALNALLAEHFPAINAGPNQLPDQPIIL
jgi:uncharacterized membrane protein